MNDRIDRIEVTPRKGLFAKVETAPKNKPLAELLRSLALAREAAQKGDVSYETAHAALKHYLITQGVALDRAAEQDFRTRIAPLLETYLQSRNPLGQMNSEVHIKLLLADTIPENKESKDAKVIPGHTANIAGTVRRWLGI